MRQKRFGVTKQTLLFIAGSVWIIAGANILRIGIITWLGDERFWLFKVVEAIIVFFLFFNFIFQRLFRKYTKRIALKDEKKHCPFSFFDTKGFIVMCCMMLFGFAARYFQLFPPSFIAVFYTGLASALLITGILFVRQGWKNKNRHS